MEPLSSNQIYDLVADILIRSTDRGMTYLYYIASLDDTYTVIGNTSEDKYKFSQPMTAYMLAINKQYPEFKYAIDTLLKPLDLKCDGLVNIGSLLSLFKTFRKDDLWLTHIIEDPVTHIIYRKDKEKDNKLFEPIADFFTATTIMGQVKYLIEWYDRIKTNNYGVTSRVDVFDHHEAMPAKQTFMIVPTVSEPGVMRIGDEDLKYTSHYNLIFVRGTNYINQSVVEKRLATPTTLKDVVWFHDNHEGDYGMWLLSDKLDLFIAKSNTKIYPLVKKFVYADQPL